MPTFFPPRRTFVPQVAANAPRDKQQPMASWTPEIGVGVNVFLYTDNTISETQPPYWDAFTNSDGTVSPGVKKVWYGGHRSPITDDESAMLTAAGYGANIT